MQLKFKASKLIEALGFVSTVEPRQLTNQANSAAYLFKCDRDREGKPYGHVYSRGKEQVSRATFALEELDGEGVFTLPKTHIDMLKEVPDDDVTLESRTETKTDGEAFVVNIHTTSGTKYNHTTFDPRLVAPCDKEFDTAKEGGDIQFNIGILREALRMAQPFLPEPNKDNVSEHFNTIQIFDQSNPECAKGDGNLFCADGSRAFYFECDEFKNKGFTIHQRHVQKLYEFLTKCHEAKIYRSKNLSFAVNVDPSGAENQLFCWNHEVKHHSRYFYYAMTRDKFVLVIPKTTLLSTLKQAQILIDEKQDRVKFVYKHNNTEAGGVHTVHFGSSESAGQIDSFPVPTLEKKDDPSLEEDFEYFVNLKAFRSIIDGGLGQQVELRISPIPKDESRPRGGAMLRTIETISFDPNGKIIGADKNAGTPRFTCKVTRFMPSVT